LEQNDNTRVFTFGIGNGCNKNLVENSAKAGKGKHYFVMEWEMDQLKAKVIDSLQTASEPALTGCEFSFGIRTTDPSSLFDPTRVNASGSLFRN
jgi:hypothetical protein